MVQPLPVAMHQQQQPSQRAFLVLWLAFLLLFGPITCTGKATRMLRSWIGRRMFPVPSYLLAERSSSIVGTLFTHYCQL
jgi:hypothetical protein